MAAGAVKKVHQRTIDSFYTQRIFCLSAHLALLSCLLIAPLTGDRFNGLRRGAERERGTYARPQRMAHSSWPYAIHSQHVVARSQRATVGAAILLLSFMMLL